MRSDTLDVVVGPLSPISPDQDDFAKAAADRAGRGISQPRKRHYRESLAHHGQVSPLFITDLVQLHLVGGSIADIGCGAGVPVSIIRARWPWTMPFIDEGITDPTFVGIDFSPRAVSYAETYGAYDRVVLAESASLPLGDQEVDVALSIENLEHLYPDEVGPALAELVRIARRRVIISTPWPWDVVNVRWIESELREARADSDPMDRAEFHVLAGAVHKSTLLPEQMAAAGFRCASLARGGVPTAHPVYVGEVGSVDVSKLGSIIGIKRVEVPDGEADYGPGYCALLEASLGLRQRVPRFKPSWYPRVLFHRVRSLLGDRD